MSPSDPLRFFSRQARRMWRVAERSGDASAARRAIRTLTAFRSLDHLKEHHAATGWTPSFRYSNRDGVDLSNALAGHGILCRLYN